VDSEASDAPGWDAIDNAMVSIYGQQEPMHWGVLISRALGGPDPLYGVSAYRADAPVPHWHYVSYGFSDLWEKETDDAELSGFGFEATFRLARKGDEAPMWPVEIMQEIARHVFHTGRTLEPGHWIAGEAIHDSSEGNVSALGVVSDPQVQSVDTPNGKVGFRQLVVMTEAELDAFRNAAQDRRLEVLMQLESAQRLWIK
jgi:suppressor of fused